MIRTRTLPIRLIEGSGLTWKTLSAALHPHFVAATELGNLVTQRLLERDARPVTGEDGVRKLPKFVGKINNDLYHEARRLFPALNSRALAQMLQDHHRNWLRSRFDVLLRRCKSPRWFTTFPQPLVVSDSFTLARDGSRWLLAFSTSAGKRPALDYGTCTRHEFCVRLRTAPGDQALLEAMLSGDHDLRRVALARDRSGRLIARLTYRFEPAPLEERSDPDRVFIVSRGHPPQLLVCGAEGGAAPWVIPGSDVRAVIASVLARRTQIAQDMKREMRLPAWRRRRRQASIERACAYRDRFLRTWCQRAAIGIVRRAVQTGCGRISVVGDAAFDFPWSTFESTLENAAAPFAAHLTLRFVWKQKEEHDESDSSPAAAAAP